MPVGSEHAELIPQLVQICRMPQFFFDIDDGDRQLQDGEGTELPSREEARREAIGILPDIAREVLPDGNHRNFICRVRNDSGAVIFTASLTLRAEWSDVNGPEPD
jgi:hypothetical protein